MLSFYLVSTQDAAVLADHSLTVKIILAFFGGIFYTSFLTAPLSVVLLVALGLTTNIYLVAVVGGLGAVIGDLIIVKFFRTIFKAFSPVKQIHNFKSLKKTLKAFHLDTAAFILGSVIVASPFPDELGLALLGASKLSYFQLSILTFILNGIGILVILFTTKGLL